MKKIISFLLCLCMTLAFFSCAEDENAEFFEFKGEGPYNPYYCLYKPDVPKGKEISVSGKTFYYDSNTNNIKINLAFLDQKNYSLEKAVYSLIHEFRHSLQISIMNGEIEPIGHCDNNILKIAYKYIDYTDNLKEYFLQPIELDAYAFAEVYMEIAMHDLQLIKSYSIQGEYEKIGELNRLIEYMELMKKDFF